MYQAWVAVPTLICSTLSAVATGTVIMLWILSRHNDKWSLRYMLIMNLNVAGSSSCPANHRIITPAEFINSWNNTISGFNVVSSQKSLPIGFSCDLNGWVGQVSVQAADFSVLAIAIITYMTVTFNPLVMNNTVEQQFFICGLVWVIPCITATVALATGHMEPVTGNWCWISREPLYLRYVLGHGWRFLIFLIAIALYICVFLKVRRRLSKRDRSPSLRREYSFSMYTTSAPSINATMLNNALVRGTHTAPITVREAVTHTHSQRNKETGIEAAQEAKQAAYVRLGVKPRIMVRASSSLDHDTKHWLLLSLFPLAYIVVWIPGLCNRFAELTGTQSATLDALQATTQLTGLVNALIYGFREHSEAHQRRTRARRRQPRRRQNRQTVTKEVY
ncbi:hypothetical protein M406DRAFT_73793 [Cryphonectria parasitica EP155]|uniref:G-protein coupled receptors family 1 profile domain-containing protein n=1 Tax=Cryphonectria parasitica (strain ATCC 38755 / EP155) TaxID=660469 RepID=A0A9P4XYL0_CRYP1|nr:uncharacterized protein M406DRAFT_73793 [Cryphonectria parasitica EP155]KAF3763165.1 hypothetical protein M406DRAFT_73793 [Cryphonectria parasitica EP155]